VHDHRVINEAFKAIQDTIGFKEFSLGNMQTQREFLTIQQIFNFTHKLSLTAINSRLSLERYIVDLATLNCISKYHLKYNVQMKVYMYS